MTQDQIEHFLANWAEEFRFPALLGPHTGQRMSGSMAIGVERRTGSRKVSGPTQLSFHSMVAKTSTKATMISPTPRRRSSLYTNNAVLKIRSSFYPYNGAPYNCLRLIETLLITLRM